MKKVTITVEDIRYIFEIELPKRVEVKVSSNGAYFKMAPFFNKFLNTDKLANEINRRLDYDFTDVEIEPCPSNSCQDGFYTVKFYRRRSPVTTRVNDTLHGVATVINIFEGE